MKTSIVHHDGTHGLFINLEHLLDSMDEYDRRKIVAYACEDAVLIESVLRAISKASQSQQIESTGDVDIWLSDSTKTKLRLAIMPLLGELHATELSKAVEKAELYQQSHKSLESLAFIGKLKREETEPHLRELRRKQLEIEYRQAMLLFPQHLPENNK